MSNRTKRGAIFKMLIIPYVTQHHFWEQLPSEKEPDNISRSKQQDMKESSEYILNTNMWSSFLNFRDDKLWLTDV